MITAIHVGSFGCGKPAFLLKKRLRRDSPLGDSKYRLVPPQYLAYQFVLHLDGTPTKLGDAIVCESCGDSIDIDKGDIRQEEPEEESDGL